MFDLNDRIETAYPDVVLLSASDVNRNGAIVGLASPKAATNSDEYFGYLLTEENELTDFDELLFDAPISCFADINGDRQVDGGDLGLCLGSWGATGACLAADLDGNGVVDGADLGLVLGQWNTSCWP